MMKFVYTIFFASLFAYAVHAHSGRTDSNGGHHDRISGGYHYHHGKPEHQHYKGHCPYDATGELWLFSGIEALIVFMSLKIRDKFKRA